jgi:hypothetical protein
LVQNIEPVLLPFWKFQIAAPKFLTGTSLGSQWPVYSMYLTHSVIHENAFRSSVTFKGHVDVVFGVWTLLMLRF